MLLTSNAVDVEPAARRQHPRAYPSIWTGVVSTLPSGTARTSPMISKRPVKGWSSLEVPTITSIRPGSTMRSRSRPVKDVRSMWTSKVTVAEHPASSRTLA